MPRDADVERLMRKLLRAIEASLAARDAARETVEEILSHGVPPSGADPTLTEADREFLRSIAIRPETY